MRLQVGQKVRLRNHWLRDGQMGEIVELSEDTGPEKYLVQFGETKLGGGIDGNKLWLVLDDFDLR